MARTEIVATQSFGAGDADLGSGTYPDWTNLNAVLSGALKVTSGVVSGTFGQSPETGDGIAAAYWSGAGSITDDQYAKATCRSMSNDSVNYGRGVVCRASGAGATRTYIGAYVYNHFTGTNYNVRLFKVTNGTYANIAIAEVAFVSNDTVSLEVSGTSPTITCKVFKNDVEIGSLTQTASVTGPNTGKPGLLGGDDGLLPNGSADEFSAGNLVGGSSSLPTLAGKQMTGGFRDLTGGTS